MKASLAISTTPAQRAVKVTAADDEQGWDSPTEISNESNDINSGKRIASTPFELTDSGWCFSTSDTGKHRLGWHIAAIHHLKWGRTCCCSTTCDIMVAVRLLE